MNWKRVWLVRRKRKRGTSYALQWRGGDGRRHTQAVGCDKRYAEELRRHKERELNSPGYIEIRHVDSEAFLEEFLEQRRGKVADSTLQQMRSILTRFFKVVSVKYLCDLDASHIEQYVTVRLDAGKSPHTVNKEFRILRAAFNKATVLRCVTQNPCEGVKQVQASQKPIRVLSPNEIQALLAAVENDEELTLLLRLLIETGARIGEVLNLEFTDIDTVQGTIVIQPKDQWMPKNRKSRVVFCSRETCDLVERRKVRTPFSYLFDMKSRWPVQTASKRFKQIAKRAGVKNCSAHDLRRTMVSQFAALGLNQAVAQQLAGHSSLDTTTRYYTGIQTETLRTAAQAAWRRLGV